MKNSNTTLQTLKEKDYIVKFYDKRYFIDRNFGGIIAKYCCLLRPDAPTIFNKIEETSAVNMSTASLNAHIGVDYDKSNYKFLNAKKELACVSVSHAEMQSYALTVSMSFQKQMSMTSKSTLYATPIPAQNTLLLSKKRVTKNSMACYFEKGRDESVAKGVSITNLQAQLELNIPLGYQAVTQEINFDNYNGNPIAVISFADYSTSIEPVEVPIIDYTLSPVQEECTYLRRKSLLEDEDDL